jgi:hypothetical protein
MKVTQNLSEEYVEKSRLLSVTDALEFLEEYRLILPLSVFEEKNRATLEAWQKGSQRNKA